MTREEALDVLTGWLPMVKLRKYKAAMQVAIDALSAQELPEGLEEAADRYTRDNMYDGWDYESLEPAKRESEIAMKKIMFNEQYGLTRAVLEGRKTMMRRIVTGKPLKYIGSMSGLAVVESKYKIGEVMAVAEAYKDVFSPLDWVNAAIYRDEPGWTNKMFVCADLMPHQIRITNVRVERLRDISDEDCIKEGIQITSPLDSCICAKEPTYGIDCIEYENRHFTSPRDAFATLIDKISGKGTWESNPWVFVYEFELVK